LKILKFSSRANQTSVDGGSEVAASIKMFRCW